MSDKDCRSDVHYHVIFALSVSGQWRNNDRLEENARSSSLQQTTSTTVPSTNPATTPLSIEIDPNAWELPQHEYTHLTGDICN